MFLAGLAKYGNVTRACRAASVARSMVYEHRGRDKAFAAAWDDALEEAADLLEGVGRDLAMGQDVPIINHVTGQPIFAYFDAEGDIVEANTPGAKRRAITERKCNATLLIFLLKGLRPTKFRDNINLDATVHQADPGVVLRPMAPPEGAVILPPTDEVGE